jgi:hypothetical protein
MGSLDLSAITGYEVIGAVPGSSAGTVVTAAGSANTEGAWVELVASTAAEASWIEVVLAVPTGTRFLVDIGTGGAGAEAVLLPDLHTDSANSTSSGITAVYRFPVAIPAGTRIAARCQSGNASATVQVMAVLGQGDPGALAAPGGVVAYGASAADSGLTAIDPGATPHTDSAWVELAASTSDDVAWLVVAAGHNGAVLGANTTWLVDIATGAAASEVVLIPDVLFASAASEDTISERARGYAVAVPAGTRIAARARCNVGTATQRLLDVAVYGAEADTAGGGGGGSSQHAHASWG